MSDSHKEAIKANNYHFTKQTIEYELRDSTRTLAYLCAKHLLEFDVVGTRKPATEVEGDPEQPAMGFSEASLPDPATYEQQFPNGVFKKGARLLDFACGPGIMTLKLAPYLGETTEIVGVDINDGFLDLFAKKIGSHARPYNYDILDGDVDTELEANLGGKFDVIICTISYHHFESYREITKKLSTFLAPGGKLMVIDFYAEKGRSIDDMGGSVRHAGGITAEALAETFSDAGLKNVSSEIDIICKLWQPEGFIKHHSAADVREQLKNGELRTKHDPVLNETNYLIESELILAVGEK